MRSSGLRTTSDFFSSAQRVIQDALTRLRDDFNAIVPENEKTDEFHIDHISLVSWPQVWEDMSCGFVEGSEEALIKAQALVIQSVLTDTAEVYHAGRFAYEVKRPSARFWQAVQKWQIVGAAEFQKNPTMYSKSTGKPKQ